ncbi:hypothetical protein [Actinomadura sp. 6K520]|jgi:hypothetical protein|uniref:hypothetical protein n=1 Tax=Actinomadura sp. 6K520 TaxID=2530364 RepID=UPI00104D86E5|nr:hypothetical protein [Actinomadura sp. 6K520]TDE38186.1 hypothetical protein E1289_03140 [Actinomadura sp. 6K520]
MPAEVRALVALHTGIVVLAASGYLLAGAITGSWVPNPWPAGLMTLYVTGGIALVGHSVWRGVTGRAAIDTESLDAIKSRCIQEAAQRPGPASAVALRPVLPHPCTSWVYTTITAQRLGSHSSGAVDVSLRTTPGWALTRRTAWQRGLVLVGGADAHTGQVTGGNVGTMEDGSASPGALSTSRRGGR